MQTGNIYSPLPGNLGEEATELLASGGDMHIERIISRGQTSPEGFWYDQNEDEWVVLLKGAARLQFENEAEELNLAPGDHILIPAHCRHRISWTDPDSDTVWLALFSKSPLR